MYILFLILIKMLEEKKSEDCNYKINNPSTPIYTKLNLEMNQLLPPITLKHAFNILESYIKDITVKYNASSSSLLISGSTLFDLKYLYGVPITAIAGSIVINNISKRANSAIAVHKIFNSENNHIYFEIKSINMLIYWFIRRNFNINTDITCYDTKISLEIKNKIIDIIRRKNGIPNIYNDYDFTNDELIIVFKRALELDFIKLKKQICVHVF